MDSLVCFADPSLCHYLSPFVIADTLIVIGLSLLNLMKNHDIRFSTDQLSDESGGERLLISQL